MLTYYQPRLSAALRQIETAVFILKPLLQSFYLSFSKIIREILIEQIFHSTKTPKPFL